MGGCFEPPCLYMELPEEICFKITLIQSKKHSGLPSPAQGPFGNHRNQFFFFLGPFFPLGRWLGVPTPTAPWCWWGLARAGLFLAGGGQAGADRVHGLRSSHSPPGDRERLEMHSHSLAAAGAITRGHRGQGRGARWPRGGLRGQEWWKGAAGGTGRAPSLQPCELWSAPSFPPSAQAGLRGVKVNLGVRGKTPYSPPKQVQALPSLMAQLEFPTKGDRDRSKANVSSALPMSVLDGGVSSLPVAGCTGHPVGCTQRCQLC